MIKRQKSMSLLGIATFIVVSVVVSSFLAWNRVNNKQNASSETSKIASESTEEIIAQVGQVAVLPPGEIPTVATIINTEILRGQSFFTNAKKGDKVLVYKIAKKAYLYDPIAHKIVDIAPLAAESVSQMPFASPSASPKRR